MRTCTAFAGCGWRRKQCQYRNCPVSNCARTAQHNIPASDRKQRHLGKGRRDPERKRQRRMSPTAGYSAGFRNGLTWWADWATHDRGRGVQGTDKGPALFDWVFCQDMVAWGWGVGGGRRVFMASATSAGVGPIPWTLWDERWWLKLLHGEAVVVGVSPRAPQCSTCHSTDH